MQIKDVFEFGLDKGGQNIYEVLDKNRINDRL